MRKRAAKTLNNNLSKHCKQLANADNAELVGGMCHYYHFVLLLSTNQMRDRLLYLNLNHLHNLASFCGICVEFATDPHVLCVILRPNLFYNFLCHIKGKTNSYQSYQDLICSIGLTKLRFNSTLLLSKQHIFYIHVPNKSLQYSLRVAVLTKVRYNTTMAIHLGGQKAVFTQWSLN